MEEIDKFAIVAIIIITSVILTLFGIAYIVTVQMYESIQEPENITLEKLKAMSCTEIKEYFWDKPSWTQKQYQIFQLKCMEYKP